MNIISTASISFLSSFSRLYPTTCIHVESPLLGRVSNLTGRLNRVARQLIYHIVTVYGVMYGRYWDDRSNRHPAAVRGVLFSTGYTLRCVKYPWICTQSACFGQSQTAGSSDEALYYLRRKYNQSCRTEIKNWNCKQTFLSPSACQILFLIKYEVFSLLISIDILIPIHCVESWRWFHRFSSRSESN